MNVTYTPADYVAAMHDGADDYAMGRKYCPPLPSGALSEGYAAGWGIAADIAASHAVAVKRDGSHGYPYRAYCECGWQSPTYVAAHACHAMHESHVSGIAHQRIRSI